MGQKFGEKNRKTNKDADQESKRDQNSNLIKNIKKIIWFYSKIKKWKNIRDHFSYFNPLKKGK